MGAGYSPAVAEDGRTQILRNHLDAALACDSVELVGLIDPSEHARTMAARRAPGRLDNILLESIDDLAGGAADVIIVSAPTEKRVDDALAAMSKKPRVLVIEKPLATNLRDAQTIVDNAHTAGITLRINFQRRLDANLQKFRAGFPGLPQKAILRYGKGLHNYASHLIDLMIDWFGPIASVQAFEPFAGAADPTITFCCRMAAGFDVVVVGIDKLAYDQFEADFFFSESRLELANSGVERLIYQPIENLYYDGYAQLDRGSLWDTPTPIGGPSELFEGLIAHFTNDQELPGCDEVAGLEGVAAIEAVIESSRAGGVSIEIDHRETSIKSQI